MLAADDVWAGTGGWAPGGIARPDEELLLGLGSAARLFGELEDALRDPEPAGIALDTAGAFRFLKETGPLLAGAGFGVLLPDWARKARLGLKLTSRSQGTTPSASASAPNGSGFGLNDLVEFRYDLAVGDTTLDADELAELAQLKIPLVRVRGQWVELDEGNLQAALKFMARGREGVMRAGDVLVAGLRGPEEDLEVTAVAADGWLGDLLSGAGDRSLTPVTAPGSFRGDLRPYQERGLAWLAFLSDLGLGGILADDMGLGKSVQTLALLDHERVRQGLPGAPPRTGPTLLVCPMSLVGNWQREAERFTPDLAVHVHHGSDRLSGADLHTALTGADLVITTYALAARDREALAVVPWQRVVCDEAQNIKNAGTRQARAVRGLPARSRLALTGTPVENHLGELWSIMEFINPGLLGPAEKFRERFAVPIAAARRRGGGGPAEAADRPVHPAPAQDRPVHHRRPARQDRDEGLLHADPGAGLALPGHRRPTCWPGSTPPRRTSSAAAWCWRPWPSSSRSATIRPTCWRTAPGCPAGPASWPGWTRCCEEIVAAGDQALSSPSTPRWAGCSSRTWPPGSAARCSSCTAGRPRTPGTRWSTEFQNADGAVPSSCSRSRPAGPGSTSPRPTTSSTSTAGGTRPSKIRPPTGPSASGSARTSRSTSSSASARWKSGSTT